MDSSIYLGCQNCNNIAEVSPYDNEYIHFEESHPDFFQNAESETGHKRLLEAIANRLESCSCGFFFRSDAALRCIYCGTELLGIEQGKRVWYHTEAEPTEQEIEIGEAAMEMHLVRAKWKTIE
jgi:hypothetical protein